MSSARVGWRTTLVVVIVVLAVVAAMVAISETRPEPRAERPPAPSGDTTSSPGHTRLEFAVWGTDPEIKAYQQVVDTYNEQTAGVDVVIRSWPTAEEMNAAVRSGDAQPDLFLLRRDDLAETLENGRSVPLLDLLDARGLNIGDDYSRDSISAFSADDDLQCMPYGSSPMVIYYNTDLVDFDKMAARGLQVPQEDRRGWTLDQFRDAAEFASRPRRGTRGVYIEPTLEGLAPFVLSGGGDLFNDTTSPTSLALGENDSTDAMRRTLEVLRDPQLTLSSAQLARRSGLEWFEQGKVGMVAGYRSLTPDLRRVEGLRFDVMPMPSLGSTDTLGELTGVCLGATAKQHSVAKAADFLIYLVGDESVATVARLGYLQPANLEVAFSEAFRQPGLRPNNAEVFIEALRDIQMLPLRDDYDELEALVGPQLRQLLMRPVLDDLDVRLDAIDETSRQLLDPTLRTEDASATPSPTD
ncbi:extracellular solute-binding protein [Nocardioides sp. GY 10113]|uniref:extracellular solute-binding protein n=1 Tax=Nocardioides sp. GY 10113 TaxID=2569761 RepID=UPI0010A89CFD|nr:extracellular solute-binding protein [Nocardioides sp. GY 10113]TIC85892.1 extracellular solute-binding protein [Nocardioides sp. GY 10113]